MLNKQEEQKENAGDHFFLLKKESFINCCFCCFLQVSKEESPEALEAWAAKVEKEDE